MMKEIISFFNSPFFIIIGGLSTCGMMLGFLYALCIFIRGVIPIWYRLAIKLSKGKIAIFASQNEYNSLRSMIIDTGIFKESNIILINKDDIKKAENANLYLVYWSDFKDNIEQILYLKKDHVSLIIYAPRNEGLIDEKIMNKINQERNCIIVNLRGRLINDVFASFITTKV